MNQRLFFPVPYPTWLCGMEGKHCTHESRIAEEVVKLAVFMLLAVGASKIPRNALVNCRWVKTPQNACRSCFDYIVSDQPPKRPRRVSRLGPSAEPRLKRPSVAPDSNPGWESGKRNQRWEMVGVSSQALQGSFMGFCMFVRFRQVMYNKQATV